MTSSTTFTDKTILYVEDEIIVALEISEVLSDMGFAEVKMAHNLRMAERFADEGGIDIALLDVNLGNGERSAELGLSLADAGVPVIFASGYNKAELAPELQSFHFLEKPMGAHELEAMLRRVAGGEARSHAAE